MKEYKECKDCPTPVTCEAYEECLNCNSSIAGSIVWIDYKDNRKPFAASICNRQRLGNIGSVDYRYQKLESGAYGFVKLEYIHKLNNHIDYLKFRKAVLAYELRKARKLIEDNTKD